MYREEWPVHAGNRMALHTRGGWVVGRVESRRPEKALTFYLPIFEYEDDERVRTETATTALTDVSLDGEVIIRDHFRLVGPKSWSGAMRFYVLDDQGAGSAGQRS